MDKLHNKVKNLRLEYEAYPQKDLLIAMPNPHPDHDYELEMSTSEFTSLCPLNPGQPDFAKITVRYRPHKYIVEFKSFKFYLASYRMVEIYYEDATNRILNDLIETIQPRKLEIIAEWTIRGGISTVVRAASGD